MKTDKRTVLRRIEAVRAVVVKEIANNASHGEKFARGLSMEGFAGGYLQALDDVDAALRHGHPSDHRGYWAEAAKKQSPAPGASPRRIAGRRREITAGCLAGAYSLPGPHPEPKASKQANRVDSRERPTPAAARKVRT